MFRRGLAATAQGRLILEALESVGLHFTAASLPIEGSCCFVRHAPRDAPWAGPWPWHPGAECTEVEEVGYLVVVIDGAKCALTIQAA